MIKQKALLAALVAVLMTGCLGTVHVTAAPALDNPQSGGVSLQGVVPTKPPTQPATIISPVSGQVTTQTPVTISGQCPKGLLVEAFSNNVFVGSVLCRDGSYRLVVDLFDGKNELVVRVFDALDQPGTDSNMVSVTLAHNQPAADGVLVLALTSAYARRGANPGQVLSWPVTLSGGMGPYAISLDWGDGKPTTLISRQLAGTFDISHAYDLAGTYTIVVRASDTNSASAYLQFTGQINGAVAQSGTTSGAVVTPGQQVRSNLLRWLAAASPIFVVVSFWFGRKYELVMLRKHLAQQIAGDYHRPPGAEG